MGLAFDVELLPSRTVSRIRAVTRLVAAAGLAVAGAQLLSGPTALLSAAQPVRVGLAALLIAAAAASLAAAMGALFRRPIRGAALATLVVDDDGHCRLRGTSLGADRPVTLRQAHILPRLILVSLAPTVDGTGQSRPWNVRTFLLGRDAMTDHRWRCLCVWLLWMSRGRHDRST